MKKICLLIILLLALMILVGCTNVSMHYKLNTDNSLEVIYNVLIDKSKDEFKDYSYKMLTNTIIKQWQAQGLEVDVDENYSEIRFTGELVKQHDSRQEAFDSLDTILKSKYSPFVSTGFEYCASYFEDEYNLSAKISLEDLIRRNDDRVLPRDIQETLTKYANESNFLLTISLPGQTVNTTADSEEYSNGVTTHSWNLKYDDEKEIALNSIIKNQENIKYFEELNHTANLNKIIFISCGAAALLFLIVFFIMFFVKRRQNQKSA